MLKTICRLFLGLMVCAGSACVTPTHASSAEGIVINYIQASGVGGAKEEVIALHNNTSEEIDITGWCLEDRDSFPFACFLPRTPKYPGVTVRYVVPAYGDIIIASSEYKSQTGLAEDYFSLIYSITNQSSGSLVGSGDTVSLIDTDQHVIDAKTWTSTTPSGKALARVLLVPSPVVYAASGDASDWLAPVNRHVPAQSLLQRYFEDIEIVVTPPDQPDTPTGPEQIPTIPTNPQAVDQPYLTEVFANPAGVDGGFEFIELYNPSASSAVELSFFSLQVGLDVTKNYLFPAGSIIDPLQYAVFYTSDMGFTLFNGSNAIQLMHNGVPVGNKVTYGPSKDDMSWVLIGETWQYVRYGSPGEKNVLPNEPALAPSESSDAPTTQKPCASNQYRNPETGRCKLLATAVASAVACKIGQERNIQTGRCRNIASTETVEAPCKAGQERNPETHRCRNIVKMSQAGSGVRGVQTQQGNQPSWYYLGAAALIVLAVVTYGVWEWRVELRNIGQRIKQRFAK